MSEGAKSLNYAGPETQAQRAFSAYACAIAAVPLALILFLAFTVVPRVQALLLDYSVLISPSTKIVFEINWWITRRFGWVSLMVTPVLVGFLAAQLRQPKDDVERKRRRRAGTLLAITTIVLILLVMLWTIVMPWVGLMNAILGPNHQR